MIKYLIFDSPEGQTWEGRISRIRTKIRVLQSPEVAYEVAMRIAWWASSVDDAKREIETDIKSFSEELAKSVAPKIEWKRFGPQQEKAEIDSWVLLAGDEFYQLHHRGTRAEVFRVNIDEIAKNKEHCEDLLLSMGVVFRTERDEPTSVRRCTCEEGPVAPRSRKVSGQPATTEQALKCLSQVRHNREEPHRERCHSCRVHPLAYDYVEQCLRSAIDHGDELQHFDIYNGAICCGDIEVRDTLSWKIGRMKLVFSIRDDTLGRLMFVEEDP